MKTQSIFYKVVFLLLILWITIAVIRTVYNVSKLVTEERQWYVLSDEQKKAKEFGDLHYFLRFVQSNSRTGSSILFFTDNTMTYYLGRYYLYPTKVIGEHEPLIWKPKAMYYDYILIYPANEKLVKQAYTQSNIQQYTKIATYKGTSGTTGVLFKK